MTDVADEGRPPSPADLLGAKHDGPDPTGPLTSVEPHESGRTSSADPPPSVTVPFEPPTFRPKDGVVTQPETDLTAALRWVIEHKSCSGFAACWEAAPATIRDTIVTAWGGDPWPS